MALVVAVRFGLRPYPVIEVPLYGTRVRHTVLRLFAIAAAAPALLGIWRIQAWLRRAGAGLRAARLPPRPGRVISDLLFAREALRRLMLLFSLMIGAVVAATGALRSARRAAAPPPADFPASDVLRFGGLFTALLALLALLFVPMYADLRASRRRMRDALSPIPRHGRPTEDRYAQRERLTALLGLNAGAAEAVQVASLVLGPFLGALVVLFVPDLRP